MAAIGEALADGLAVGRKRRAALAALDPALDFRTWRTLVRANRLLQDRGRSSDDAGGDVTARHK